MTQRIKMDKYIDKVRSEGFTLGKIADVYSTIQNRSVTAHSDWVMTIGKEATCDNSIVAGKGSTNDDVRITHQLRPMGLSVLPRMRGPIPFRRAVR